MPAHPTKRLIGVDEAGYGPNLGPLVVAATLWEVPAEIDEDAHWRSYDGIVSRQPDGDGQTIHIADSKQVHSAAAGIGPLENSALAILELSGQRRENFAELWATLHAENKRHLCREPWFRKGNCRCPARIEFDALETIMGRWRRCCSRSGCQLLRCEVDFVPAERFNREVERTGSKGRVLSETTLRLVRRLWDSSDETPALVYCDKHGGRNRYADMLADVFPEHLTWTREESRACSRYRISNAQFEFRPRSEDRLPVAAASIIAKYLRELAMDIFNEFWSERIVDLKPTRGYPVDARRFLQAISAPAEEMGLKREWYWRFR